MATTAPTQTPAATTTTTTTAASSSTSAAASPSLILTPSQFASLQPHIYLLTHLSPPPDDPTRPSLRVNGRSTSQFRDFTANTGSLTHAHGSAVVRIGDATAVCGVRGEILRVQDIPGWDLEHAERRQEGGQGEQQQHEGDIQDQSTTTTTNETELYNLLVPNVSLNTGCLPSVAPGAAPGQQAQGLSHEVLTLLNKSRLLSGEDLRIYKDVVDLTKLAPEDSTGGDDGDVRMDTDTDSNADADAGKEVAAYWTLYIDVLVISAAGPLLDIAWPAVIAALRNTRLPRAYWDEEREGVVCSDSLEESLSLESAMKGASPVACTFAVFNGTPPEQRDLLLDDGRGRGGGKSWVLADPDAFEESLCPEKVTIVLDHGDSASSKGGKIIKIEKNGGLSVGPKGIRDAVASTTKRWGDMKKVLDAECSNMS